MWYRVLTSWPVVSVSLLTTSVGSMLLIKEYLNPRYNGNESLKGKVVVITGANTGIGKQVAKQLAQRGGRVIMGCRDDNKCMIARKEIILETKNPNVVCRPLDLSSLKSVREFAQSINKNESALHLLINNAGVMNCPKSLTIDGFEMHLGVNHLGHFLLTMLLLDKLKSCAPSRIINISSVAHKRGSINFDDINSSASYSPKAAYSQSKLANILFTRQLAQLLKGTDVFVYAVHPGLVNTEITRHMSFYNSITAYIVKPILWVFLVSASHSAHSILYCALNPDIQNDSFNGKYFRSKVIEVSPEAQDDITAKKLWLLSEKWTKFK